MRKRIKVPFWFLNNTDNQSADTIHGSIHSLYNNCLFKIVNDRELGKIILRVMPQFLVYDGEKSILDSGYTNDYCFDCKELILLTEKLPQIMKDAHAEFIKNFQERSANSMFKDFNPVLNEKDFMKRFKLQFNQIEL